MRPEKIETTSKKVSPPAILTEMIVLHPVLKWSLRN